MTKINQYLSKLTLKYLLINTLVISVLIIFVNILEISRIIDNSDNKLYSFLYLSILKLPSVINETIPFIVVISIAFLYRNLISNNELISMRNMGFSILDIFKPIAITILICGILILCIFNPIISFSENKFIEITDQKNSDIYSIKFIEDGMWIKNLNNKNQKNYINIKNINLNNMIASQIKILTIGNINKEIILANKGKFSKKNFNLEDVAILDIDENNYYESKNEVIDLNFNRSDIIDAISNYKIIPFYKYYNHVVNLKKFDLYSNEISLYYISELLKPLFLIIIGFVVMGFSSQFKRNENFFKVLFISVLIGFIIFLFKIIIFNFTGKSNINFIYSYLIILIFPGLLGLYQVVKIERN
tara:strand:- start:6 stop:1085 length:1080 start_codon:yes stop_codon:yes gene_type:complete